LNLGSNVVRSFYIGDCGIVTVVILKMYVRYTGLKLNRAKK